MTHPDRVQALVVQNGNAYVEGIDNDFWKPLKAYWQEEERPKRERPARLHYQGSDHTTIHRRRAGYRINQSGQLECRSATIQTPLAGISLRHYRPSTS
jgi:hypothetical protein